MEVYERLNSIGMKRMELAKRNSNASAISIERNVKQRKFAVCIRNEGYQASLERHKIYQVLPDPEAEKHGDLRIVDESGEDYLYPADWFVPIQVPEKVKASLARAS